MPTSQIQSNPVPASSLEDIFGPVIYSYTRKQALADGFQVDVTRTAAEAGIKFPCFVTRAVWDSYVKVPPGVVCQDEAGRLWDLVWMTRCAIRATPPGKDRMTVSLMVRNDNQRARMVRLTAVCAALDIDDASPSITLMMPSED